MQGLPGDKREVWHRLPGLHPVRWLVRHVEVLRMAAVGPGRGEAQSLELTV